MASSLDQEWAARLREAGVPVLEGTRGGLRALAHLLRLGEDVPAAEEVLAGDAVPASAHDSAPDGTPARAVRWRARLAEGPLSGAEGFALLADYGVPVVPVVAVCDGEAAVAAAGRLGGPVVLKTDAPGLAHKSDVGGVVLGLGDATSVRAAYDDMVARLGPRALVCATAPEGVEMVVGLSRDPLLGPLVVVGAGGVLGWRGRPPVDRDALVRVVRALAELAVELGDALDALDVNPLVAHADGVVAVDVLTVPHAGGTSAAHAGA
jgi:acyl-CoA synthetase (NDP forming)